MTTIQDKPILEGAMAQSYEHRFEASCKTAVYLLNWGCEEDGNGSINWVGPLIIFLGLVLTGVGNCFYWMFGVSYLDNNSKHEKSPMMLGITYTFR